MKFDSSRPIYLQIIDNYKKQLIRGEIKSGEKILSQREFAERQNVNPNTVQRAYREMEMMELVKTIRGQGTFVSVEEDALKSMKVEMAKELLAHFINEMRSLGFADEEIWKVVKKNSVKDQGG